MSKPAALLLTTACLLVSSCSGETENENLKERFAFRVSEQVYSVPFEYKPYAGNLIAGDLHDLQRRGVGVAGNPFEAQQISFRTNGEERAGVSSLSMQIYGLKSSELTERQMAREVDVESVKAISVTEPIPGDDDPNSVYRLYEVSADFELADGRFKSVPFDCQGGDGFGEVIGETIFGCYLGLVVDKNTGLLLRLGPYEDPGLIKEDISFALSCLLTLRQGEQQCQ